MTCHGIHQRAYQYSHRPKGRCYSPVKFSNRIVPAGSFPVCVSIFQALPRKASPGWRFANIALNATLHQR